MRRGQNHQVHPWTPSDIERLKELLLAHTPIAEIALELGRTEGAVRTRASQLGISLMELKRRRAGGI